MDIKTYNYFGRRAKHQKHDNLLTPNEKDRERIQNAEKFIEIVFKNQIAAYHDLDYYTNLFEWNTRPIIAKKFYQKYYSVPQIKQDGKEADIDIESFIKEVFEESDNANKNKFSVLLGNVGVGKTAFINYLISTQFEKYKGKFIFVRIDLETIYDTNNDKIDIEKIIRDGIIEKFIHIIDKHFNYKAEFDTTPLNREKQAFYTKKKNFSNFIKDLYHKKNIRLVLIFDNLDIIYHREKRGFFINKDTEILKSFKSLVKEFAPNNNQNLSSLYANVLFVMRKDTFHYIKSESMVSSSPLFTDVIRYELGEYKWDEIVEKRFEMLYDLVNERQINTIQKDIIVESFEKTKKYLKNSQIELIKKIQKLTNYGLREMMEYLNKHSHISFLKESSFIEKTPVGLIAFMLKGHELYTDEQSAITNIFLNDKENYKHITYWLKYLILKYLQSRKDRVVTIENIYDIFCDKETQKEVYDKNQIDTVIDSLCDSNFSNMINVEKRYDDAFKTNTIYLQITEKGEYIMDQLIFRFFYLQLIIDDWLLPLPEIMIDKKSKISSYFNYENTTGYSYILYQDEQYINNANTVIREKGKSVLLFMQLLKVSLIYERKKYSDVFNNLIDLGIELPDIEEKIVEIKNELKAIYLSKNLEIKFTPNIDGYIHSIDKESAFLIGELNELYKNL